MTPTPVNPNYVPCSIPRRLAAAFYDALLLIAVLFVATIPWIVARQGHAVAADANLAYQLYLLAIVFVFYAGFWRYGGQTLGMRTWRLRVVRRDGTPLGWRDAAVRFALAWPAWLLVGLGILWSAFDPEGLAWHDRGSNTRLIYEGPRS